MNILIDIIHPADVNFYKRAISILSKKHNIVFTVLKRGRVPQMVEHEFPNHKKIVFGTYYSPFILKLWTIAIRQLHFLWLYATKKVDVVSSFGFYPGFLAPLFGIKAIQFHDDKEYSFNFKLTKAYASRFVSLCDVKSSKKVRRVHSYKELSYLQPFKKDDGVLKKLQLRKDKYVYIREVAGVSLNYRNEEQFDYQPVIDYFHKKGFTVLLDSEDPSKTYKNVKIFKSQYTTQEIRALHYHAALIITSGDTVLREGALIGTPTIYTSKREMEINKDLKEKGLFSVCLTTKELLSSSSQLVKKKTILREKAKQLRETCEDMTKVIVEEIEK